jgi:hypothetical protein
VKRREMTRIVKTIEVEDKEVLALFDTGAVHTYIQRNLAEGVPRRSIVKRFKVALGTKEIEVDEFCLIHGRIEGLDFDTKAVPVDEIGKINGKDLDVLIGALTMEEWEIIPNPKDATLDLSGLRRREFTEFS